MDQLADLDRRHRINPDARAAAAPSPPTVPEPRWPRTTFGPARLPLAEALADIPDAFTLAPKSASPPPPDPEDQTTALRLYAMGRLALHEGRDADAVRHFTDAAALDRASPTLWKSLGQAQIRNGDQRAALAAFEQALTLGSADPLVLMPLAADAQEKNDHPRAVSVLRRLVSDDAAAFDPALPYMVHAALGQSLLELGYLAAGAQALNLGINLPEPFTNPTRFRNELGTLYRSRADGFITVGDALFAIDDNAGALDAYDRAYLVPSLDRGLAQAKRVHAAMRSGNPARAAIAIVQDLQTTNGLIDDRQPLLIRHVRAHAPSVAPHLASAILALRDADATHHSPSITARLTRAAANAMPPPQARETLADWLAYHPTDAAVLADLVDAAPDPAALVPAFNRIAEAAPEYADDLASRLADAALSPDTLTTALRRHAKSPGGRLMAALTNDRIANHADAISQIRQLHASDPSPAASLALAQIAARNARADLADTALTVLAADTSPSGRLLTARALYALQQFDAALDTLRPALSDLQSAPALIFAATLAATLNDHAQAAQHLEHLLRLDPFNEDVHVMLIDLYAENGPIPDRDRLVATLQSLRTVAPSSRSLRLLRARERVRAGQYPLAEAELHALLQDSPHDRRVADTTLTFWLTRAAQDPPLLDRAEQILRERLTDNDPKDTWPVMALARVLSAKGQHAEAEQAAQTALATAPVTRRDDLQRVIEAVMRASGRRDEADRRVEQRLADAPRSIPVAVELTIALADQRRVAEAAQTLDAAMPAASTFTPAQSALLMPSLIAVASASLDAEDPLAAAPAAELFRVVADRLGTRAPAAIHELRTRLLAETSPVDVPALVATTRLASSGESDPVKLTTRAVTSRLVQRGLTADALAYLRAIAAEAATPDPQLLQQWLALVIQVADPEQTVDAVTFLEQRNLIAAALGDVELVADDPQAPTQPDPAVTPPPDPPSLTASDLAYVLAGELSIAGKHAHAERLYTFILERQPDHVWANNNLGYSLLERGERLDDAERMLERAYAAAPSEPSVIDSLGWLRYTRGVLHDQLDPDTGTIRKEGAATLLSRAAATRLGSVNPTILDHAADAAWLIGEHDDARRLWAEAERLAALRLQSSERQLTEQAERRVRELMINARAKRRAASRGDQPRVAPHAPIQSPAADPADPPDPDAPSPDPPRQ